jgi:hypothetical protein
LITSSTRFKNLRQRAVLTAEVQPLDYCMEAKQAKTLLDTGWIHGIRDQWKDHTTTILETLSKNKI